MGVQFGHWNFNQGPIDPGYWDKVQSAIAPHGPDGRGDYSERGLFIHYRAMHSTKESRRETQPHVFSSGSVLLWDGRLDNRDELVRDLGYAAGDQPTDLELIAAAYQQQDTNSFARLVGDWALAVWNPNDRCLILTKDPIGTRPLYYSLANNQVRWSTLLEPLVELAESRFRLEPDYLAGWLSLFPATHLTPYVGISSVPACTFVRIQYGRLTTTKYWDFDTAKKIRYDSDQDYEEHFRAVFREAIRRRLRSDACVLAELSGGMDSSSIVCVADRILESRGSDAYGLVTVSYYDDSEPAWDERPYFTMVEQQRGRVGCHIDLGRMTAFEFRTASDHYWATPGSDARMAQITEELRTYMRSHGSRVILSGIGGDEFTGGVPTPAPELADLLARAKFGKLAHRLKVWALLKRTPWLHLLGETIRPFSPPAFVPAAKQREPAPWLLSGFISRHAKTLRGYQHRLKFSGPLPSFQENLATLEAMRRQISCTPPETFCERRYPYLDRDFLEFLFAIPREQLVRPGQRRSLMRRALAGIVPDPLLNRKRKAFVARSPRMAIANHRQQLVEMSREMICDLLGIVDPRAFRQALEAAGSGQHVAIVPLLRTLELESWLRNLRERGILDEAFAPMSLGRRAVTGANHAGFPRSTESQLRKNS